MAAWPKCVSLVIHVRGSFMRGFPVPLFLPHRPDCSPASGRVRRALVEGAERDDLPFWPACPGRRGRRRPRTGSRPMLRRAWHASGSRSTAGRRRRRRCRGRPDICPRADCAVGSTPARAACSPTASGFARGFVGLPVAPHCRLRRSTPRGCARPIFRVSGTGFLQTRRALAPTARFRSLCRGWV